MSTCYLDDESPCLLTRLHDALNEMPLDALDDMEERAEGELRTKLQDAQSQAYAAYKLYADALTLASASLDKHTRDQALAYRDQLYTPVRVYSEAIAKLRPYTPE